MRKWLAARRRKAGFDWAAAELLRTGDMALMEAYLVIYGSRGSPFDQGVAEALEAWRNTP